jgi:L-alanine-DL-glutamate epimerase-like enolase superfamily enzyme
MTTLKKRAPATFDIAEGNNAPGLDGYYADDLLAVQAGAEPDGLVYRGAPLTPGHRHIRNPAQAMLIRLQSSDGHVGWGDAVTVQYSGFAGRERPLDPAALAPQLALAFEALGGRRRRICSPRRVRWWRDSASRGASSTALSATD